MNTVSESVIWTRGASGSRQLFVTLPSRWQGEVDCVVGPFSSREVANYFASNVVDFGQLETTCLSVFAHGDGWYLEVKAVTLASNT